MENKKSLIQIDAVGTDIVVSYNTPNSTIVEVNEPIVDGESIRLYDKKRQIFDKEDIVGSLGKEAEEIVLESNRKFEAKYGGKVPEEVNNYHRELIIRANFQRKVREHFRDESNNERDVGA